MLSGLAMGLLDHEGVQGHKHQAHVAIPSLADISAEVADLAVVMGDISANLTVTDVRLHSIVGRTIYRVRTPAEKFIYDASRGSRIKIDADFARSIAIEDYSGEGSVSSVTDIAAPSMEVRRHEGKVWRINFDDDDETTLYISAQDGSILERRNATWRIFDVFWMLHIMDYQEREKFNNVFAITFSLAAAWFAITGVVLLFGSFTRSEFVALLPGGRWTKVANVTVCAPHGEVVARLTAVDGASLYDELARQNIVLPSNCGGGGTCGLCVVELGDSAVETAADKSILPAYKRAQGLRLSCQARVTAGLSVVVPESVLAAETISCTVTETRLVTPSIREITLALGSDGFEYLAGSFVHVAISTHSLHRAYSLATAPEDNPGQIVLNVRMMPPPPGSNAPAGIGSSFMWSLNSGDSLDILGPLGDFHATNNESDTVFVGGGAGMAPLRAIIRSELLYKNSNRRIDFWYGARSSDELFYADEFEKLQAQHPNFTWHAVLSETGDEVNWQGPTGFVHQSVKAHVLDALSASRNFEYYVCGPPPMLAATRSMLADHGVPDTSVFFDDFGI